MPRRTAELVCAVPSALTALILTWTLVPSAFAWLLGLLAALIAGRAAIAARRRRRVARAREALRAWRLRARARAVGAPPARSRRRARARPRPRSRPG